MLGQGLASVVDAGATLRQRWSNFLCLPDMRCTGPVWVLSYTGRTPAQCFLCGFFMYKYAYFNLIICIYIFFFTYITCFVIITVLNSFINKNTHT